MQEIISINFALFQLDADFEAKMGPKGIHFIGSFKALYLKGILKYVEKYAPAVQEQLSQFETGKY